MAKKGQVQVQEKVVEEAPVFYTQEEVDEREDLLQKLLTLDHVKSILVSRGDSPLYIRQVEDLASIIRGWIDANARAKSRQVEENASGQKGSPGKGADDDDDDNKGDEGKGGD